MPCEFRRVLPLISMLCLGLLTLPSFAQTPENSVFYATPETPRATCEFKASEWVENSRLPAPSHLYNQAQVPVGMFDVTVDSGVPSNVQDAVEFAAGILNVFFNLNTTVNVHVTYNASAPNNLGSCSADWWIQALLTNNVMAPGSTLPYAYPGSLAKQFLEPGDYESSAAATDLTLNLNSAWPNWYFGTDANCPAGQTDMVMVSLHEIIHGMGFSGWLTAPVTDASGNTTQGWSNSTQTIYDNFTADSLGNLCQFMTSPQLVTISTWRMDFFGPNTVAANGGVAPELFAPNPWNPGSSYSHFDDAAHPPGSFNELMTPFLGSGYSNHTPGLLGISLMEDLGYSVNKGFGCTHDQATNFDPSAVFDDGNCVFPPGCTDPNACNFFPEASSDDGSCYYPNTCANPIAIYLPFDFNTNSQPAIMECNEGGTPPPGYYEATNFECALELTAECQTWGPLHQDFYLLCVDCPILGTTNEPPSLDTSSPYFDEPLVTYCDYFDESMLDQAVDEIVSNIVVTDECPDHVHVNYAVEFTPFCGNAGVYDLFLYFIDPHDAVTPWEVQFTVLDVTNPVINYNPEGWTDWPWIEMDHPANSDHSIDELMGLGTDIAGWPDWARPENANSGAVFLPLNYASDNCVATNELGLSWEVLSLNLEFQDFGTEVRNYSPRVSLNTLATVSDSCGNYAAQAMQVRLHSGEFVHSCGWWLPTNGSGPAILNCHSPGEGYEFAFCQECANQVIENDSYCVDNQWDSVCENAYLLCLGTPPPSCQCQDLDADYVCDFYDDDCVGEETTDYLEAGYFVRDAFKSNGDPYYTLWLHLNGDGTGTSTHDIETPEAEWTPITYSFCEPLNGPVKFIADPWYLSGTFSGDTVVGEYYSNNIDDAVTAYMFPANVGCLDEAACNFDSEALFEDGSCEYLSCAGCTDSYACNYDATATIADDSCIYSGPECYCAEPIPFYTAELYPYQEVVVEWEGAFASLASLDIDFEFTSLNIAQAGHLLVGICSPNGVCVEVGGYDLSLGMDNLGAFPADWNTTASGAYSTSIDVSGAGLFGEGTWGVILLNGYDTSNSVGVWEGKVTLVGMCDEIVVPGCTDATACNYQDFATINDGSCVYTGPLCECSLDLEVEALNLASGASETWTVTGTLSEAQTLEASLDFTDVNANFAGDLLLAICDPNGTCIEMGGYDMTLGYENVALWPSGWNVSTSGTYTATIDLSAVGLSGDGDWSFTLYNAYSFSSAAGNWSGSLSLVGSCGVGPACETDVDADGVCDEEDPCVGEVDACGVCNGPGAIYECGCEPTPLDACDCFGNTLDALGVCGGDCSADENGDGVCDSDQVLGCTDLTACNYDSQANADDGSCIEPDMWLIPAFEQPGGAIPYCGDVADIPVGYIVGSFYCVEEVVNDHPDCIYLGWNEAPNAGASEGYGFAWCESTYIACLNDAGCTDTTACNYEPEAVNDDGTCAYPGDVCAEATDCASEGVYEIDCSCTYTWQGPDEDGDGICDDNEVLGCTDEAACNFMITATEEDGSCLFPGSPCEDAEGACNGVAFLDENCWCVPLELDSDGDGICDGDEVAGCPDPEATNFNPEATDDDGSCEYAPPGILGCTDPLAFNFDPGATEDDGSCIYGNDDYYGCTDWTACNYNPDALEDDGSCLTGSDCTCTETLGLTAMALMGGSSNFLHFIANLTEAQNLDANITFSDSSGDSFAGDLVLGLCDPNGNCVEIGGANLNLGYTSLGLWPSSWNTSAAGTYIASVDLTGSGLGGDGTWTLVMMNGYSFASAVGTWTGAFELSGACGDDECLTDADADGVCDDEDDCVGVLDACGVCNGPGEIYDCGCSDIPEGACDCDGNQLDALGVCGGLCLADSNGNGICDSEEIECPDPTVTGCMDEEACNYWSEATYQPEGICWYSQSEFLDCDGNCINDEDGDGVCDEFEIYGCGDPAATNYNPACTDCVGIESFDCEYPLTAGCMDPNACNFWIDASYQPEGICWYSQSEFLDCDGNCINDEDGDGVCDEFEIYGCGDPAATNYNPACTDCVGIESFDCEYPLTAGCMDPNACNFWIDASYQPEGICWYSQSEFLDCDGNCIDDADGDGVCDAAELEGCLDASAVNYNPLATNAGTCIYPEDLGCTYPEACNYDEFATADNGACVFPEVGYDCQGNSTGTGSTCVGDLNNSGAVETSDLLVLLSAFGNTCDE